MCVIGFDSQPYFVRIPLLFSAKLHKAGIAQLVEHHLAKVEVASSSLVSRSNFNILRDLITTLFRCSEHLLDIVEVGGSTKRECASV